MGNAPSSHEAPRSLPRKPEPRRPKSIATLFTTPTPPPHEIMGNQESRQAHDKKAAPIPYRPPQTKAKPINVPADKQQLPSTAHDPPSSSPQQLQPLQQQPQSPPREEQPMPFDAESYSMNTSALSRPPRLPLPIEEEDHTPGSPIISPADVSGPVGPIEPLVAGLPRRSSVLSSTTLDDEDDLGDDLGSLEGGPHIPVPTLLEWREAGDKVYVTGTFAGWDRKFRLHKKYVPCSRPYAAVQMLFSRAVSDFWLSYRVWTNERSDPALHLFVSFDQSESPHCLAAGRTRRSCNSFNF